MGWEHMHTQTHTPGLLAVICIRRAICLRSDRGYPNKRLAWDFLPPPSFFIFFLSGPSLSVRKKKKQEIFLEKPFHLKWRVHCYSDVFLLLLYLYAEKQMTSMRFERKDKKKHSLKPAKCRQHFLSPPSLHWSVLTKHRHAWAVTGQMEGELKKKKNKTKKTHTRACVFTAA